MLQGCDKPGEIHRHDVLHDFFLLVAENNVDAFGRIQPVHGATGAVGDFVVGLTEAFFD